MTTTIVFEITEIYLKMAFRLNTAGDQGLKVIVKPVSGLDRKQVIQLVQDSVRELRVKTGPVVLCLSRNQVTVRNLQLPSENKQEIEQMVDLAVGRNGPYKKEEVIYSYRLLGKNEMGYARVIAAVVHRDVVERLAGIIEAAGFFVEDIILSSYGIAGYITHHKLETIPAGERVLCLDIDSAYSDLLVLENQEVISSRSIPLDSSQLLQEIGVRKLTGEIRQSLVIFNNEQNARRPTAMYISGAGAGLADLCQSVEKELDIPVHAVIPECQTDKTFSQMVSVIAVLELVSRQLTDDQMSFTLPEIQIRKSLREKSKDILVFGMLMVFLLSAVCAFFYARIYHQEKYLEKLKTHNQQYASSVDTLAEKARQIEFVRTQLADRKKPLFLVGRLSQILPSSIAIKFLSLDKSDKVTLRGEAQELSDVFKFVGSLEKEDDLKNLQTKSTRKRKTAAKEVTDFELLFSLDPEGKN